MRFFVSLAIPFAEGKSGPGTLGTSLAKPWDAAGGRPRWKPTPPIMIELVIVFAVLALIAAIFGFGGVASQFAGIAKILLVIFIILAIVAFFF